MTEKESEQSIPVTKPANPSNASEAAKLLLQRLPMVKNPEDGRYYYGYYQNGKAMFTPQTLDRSLVTGTLQGIAEGRVLQGDKSLVGSLNAAFIRPLEGAIAEAKASTTPMVFQNLPLSASPNPVASPANLDIRENQKLLTTLLNGVDWAASFGLFTDQALQVKHKNIGFSAAVRA